MIYLNMFQQIELQQLRTTTNPSKYVSTFLTDWYPLYQLHECRQLILSCSPTERQKVHDYFCIYGCCFVPTSDPAPRTV